MSNAVISDWPSGSANQGWPQEPSAMLMPGRVQGWPAGTQRAANPAQRLLSQAVAWWDVEEYREGDRFLRNRGTGGELLDLRLGSALAPNSNDPLYLPSADDGYVYLSGVAGNSLSVTAPATATQYIAYPLDRSASTATGAVTGGATFTFSTAGSWRLIELLDASNVVVDTIDCDAITSGSATSFTAVSNQTVTINRSLTASNVRRAVAMPSRSKGGQPLFLFGADDFMAIPAGSTFQHGLLNSTQGQSLTAIAAVRIFADTGSGNSLVILTKSLGTNVTGRWFLRSDPTLGAVVAVGNQSEAIVPASASVVRGPVNVLAGVIDRTANQMTLFHNGTSGSPVSIGAVVDVGSTNPFMVGQNGAGSAYLCGELYAAAVFRRALSADEIKTISTYFTGRIA